MIFFFVSIVTTAGPLFSKALATKDFFVDVLVSMSHHMGYGYEQTFEHLTSSYNFEYPSSGDKRYKKSLI